MWTRGICGLVLVAVGAVWFTQGVGALRGSVMTGQPVWTGIGLVLIAAGAACILWAGRVRRRRLSETE